MAVLSKKVPAALLLINKGASLYFEYGRNALCAASFHSLKEVAQAAISKGIYVNEAFCWRKPPMPSAIKTYPIQYAVQSGDADTVAYLLKQGANLNWFEVYPFGAHGEMLCNDPFSVAWKERRYDIFLLLLEATLTYKSQKRRMAPCGLLSPLEKTEPKERLAERLAPWLEVLDWESFDPSGGA
ncbi:hypothetical protein FANTH_14896 [Fusarium anthophilum]|uniref:Ankyrin repeat domain-containing protein n=1 Tax=Fusarium anthophilum TaxID=48485 RepID=A0A8H4YFJ8_9HYPO|nr:hypothetical protein FANTH_14896 [Fusarium anthophilum]